MLRNEVEISDALRLTELEEETLLKLAEAGKVKVRRAGGTVYFDRAEIEALIERMADEARKEIAW